MAESSTPIHLHTEANRHFEALPAPTIAAVTTSSPAKEWSSMIGSRWAELLAPSSVSHPIATATTTFDQSDSSNKVVDCYWFRSALEKLATELERAKENPELYALLKDAEYLIAHFSVWPEVLRPRFAIDTLDRPSFSSKSARHYLHATLDPEVGFNWYAELDGEELEAPDEEPNEFRHHLPPSLTFLCTRCNG